jgi:hypothetical protein
MSESKWDVPVTAVCFIGVLIIFILAVVIGIVR